MAEFSFSKPLAHTRVLRTHSQTTASTQTVPKTDVGGHKVQAQSTSGSQSLSSIVEPSLDNSSVSQTTSSGSHLLQHDDEMHKVPAKKETKRKSSAAAVHGGDKTRATRYVCVKKCVYSCFSVHIRKEHALLFKLFNI